MSMFLLSYIYLLIPLGQVFLKLLKIISRKIYKIAFGRIVDINIDFCIRIKSSKNKTAVSLINFLVFARAKNFSESGSDFTELLIIGNQLAVQVFPIKTSAAKRIDVTLRRIFVAVINTRNAGQSILKQRCHFYFFYRKLSFFFGKTHLHRSHFIFCIARLSA